MTQWSDSVMCSKLWVINKLQFRFFLNFQIEQPYRYFAATGAARLVPAVSAVNKCHLPAFTSSNPTIQHTWFCEYFILFSFFACMCINVSIFTYLKSNSLKNIKTRLKKLKETLLDWTESDFGTRSTPSGNFYLTFLLSGVLLLTDRKRSCMETSISTKLIRLRVWLMRDCITTTPHQYAIKANSSSKVYKYIYNNQTLPTETSSTSKWYSTIHNNK